MARQQGWFAFLLALVLITLSFCFNQEFQLGLDLRGGSQLTLEVQPLEDSDQITPDQIDAVKAVLERRVNSFGVSETTLQTVGSNQIIVELPDEQETSSAVRVLGETALLEFRAQKPRTEDEMRTLLQLRAAVKNLFNKVEIERTNQSKTDFQIDSKLLDPLKESLGLRNLTGNYNAQLNSIDKTINQKIVSLLEPSTLTGKDLVSAGRRQEQNLSTWEVTLTFNQVGGEKFAGLTKSIAGTNRLLGIVIDGKFISGPTVGDQFQVAGITGGSATISGNFTAQSARELEIKLKDGSLPLPVKIIQVRTIGPTLGVENIQRSLKAALAGLLLVAIFMIVFYRVPGLVAVIALSFYALFNIAVYALLKVTLTLPGIAGFILSIGMAVDANVLIFERVKDELRAGNTLIRSIDAGFSQAFSSIIDGHITTLISCTALYYLGTGFVRGFSATLGIGVVISLFTALSCTRVLIRFLMGYKSMRRPVNFLPINDLPN